MKKIITVTITELLPGRVNCKVDSETEIQQVHHRAFFRPDLLEVGEKYVLGYSEKNKVYDEFSLVFMDEYYNRWISSNQIYTGEVMKVIKNFTILYLGKGKYVKINNSELGNLEKVREENKVEFAARKNKAGKFFFSSYEAALLKFKNNHTDDDTLYTFQFKNCEKIKNMNGDLIGFQYLVQDIETGGEMKIFISLFDKFKEEHNCEILNGLVLGDAFQEIFFRYCKFNKDSRKSDRFELDTGELFYKKNIEWGTLIKNQEKDDSYYIKSDFGVVNLNLYRYSVLEKTLLSSFVGELVPISSHIGNRNRRVSYNLKKYDREEIEILDGEFTDVKIEKVIPFFLGKTIFRINLTPEREYPTYGFIEEKELSYVREILEIGTVLEKVKGYHKLKEFFFFYTRLPYIKNPLTEILKNVNIGDWISGKVFEVSKNYLTINLEGKYLKSIPKKDLLPLNFFEIEEFYEKDKTYNFFIMDKSSEEITLSGYNPADVDNVYYHFKRDENIEALLYKKNITKYIFRMKFENIWMEVELPNDEISYFSNEETNFENGKYYDLKIINNPRDDKKIIASRKRLSKNISHPFKRNFKVGNSINGDYITEDENGFYLSLFYGNEDFKNIIGYLPFNKLSLYPDVDEFRAKLKREELDTFTIESFPSQIDADFMGNKAVELTLLDSKDSLDKIVEKIDFSQLKLDLCARTEIVKLDTSRDKIYLLKEMDGKNIVFSIDREELYFEKINEDNYLEEILKHLDYLKNMEKDSFLESIVENILSNFDNNIVRGVAFREINRNNNTIEVSIKEHLIREISKAEREIKHFINWSYLLGNEQIGIPVEYINVEKLDPYGNYIFKICSSSKNKLKLTFQNFTAENIGSVYEVKVLEKTENFYIGESFSHKIHILSPYELQVGERVHAEFCEVSEEIIKGKLKIYSEEVEKNCAEYIDSYLKKNIKDLELNFLQKFSDKIHDKKIFLGNLGESLKDLSNTYKIYEYIFNMNSFSSGNFGKVYFGKNLLTEEKVILKRYSADRNIPEYNSFLGEARLLKNLDLINTMKVFINNENEFVGEFIHGETLREKIISGLTRKEKIKLLIDIGIAIDEIHENKIIHLDLKPENIMIEKTGTVKLIDFGSAQYEDECGKFGTLLYSSPKQCEAYTNGEFLSDYSPKDDIYSYGIIAYELFVGKTPYWENLEEDTIIKGHIMGREASSDKEYAYVSPGELDKDMDSDLEFIINKCLENSEERYENLRDVVGDLEFLYMEE